MPDPTRWPGRKIEPAPDPTASRVGSGSGRVGPGLCKMSGSFGFFGFRVKIFSPCPARQSYRVKNFDPSPPIKLFGSGRVGLFSGGLGRVRRVGQPMPRSTWDRPAHPPISNRALTLICSDLIPIPKQTKYTTTHPCRFFFINLLSTWDRALV